MKSVAIIGAGSWGTALAEISARAGHEVRVWSRTPGIVQSINERHVNPRYLKETQLSNAIVGTLDLSEAVDRAELVVLATPSHSMREILGALKPVLRDEMILVSAAKGIEIETGQRMSELATDVLGSEAIKRFVCLTGPSFAREVVDKHPTAVVVAGSEPDCCRAVQAALSFENLRIYTNDDLIGAELGGAIKNVIAIAAGMVAGMGFGANSIAALITRGLAEMTRLALKEGAKPETLMGLAGLGDLVLTCTGSLSRNRHLGMELGKGRGLAEIDSEMNEVAEGITTTLAVKQMADRQGIETPITAEVHSVLYERKSPEEAVNALMMRPLRDEHEGTA